MVYAVGFRIDVFLENAVFLNVLAKGGAIDALAREVKQIAFSKFAKDTENAACAILLLDAVLLPVGGELAEERGLAREGVNVLHREIHLSLLGNSQQVEHRIRRGTHRYIERHGVEESLTGGYASWQYALVAVFVVSKGVLDDKLCSVLEELDAVLVRSEYTTVAWQRKADGLSQRIH